MVLSVLCSFLNRLEAFSAHGRSALMVRSGIAAKCIGFTFRMTNIAHACKKQLSYWYPYKEVFGDNRELIMYIKEALLSF